MNWGLIVGPLARDRSIRVPKSAIDGRSFLVMKIDSFDVTDVTDSWCGVVGGSC